MGKRQLARGNVGHGQTNLPSLPMPPNMGCPLPMVRTRFFLALLLPECYKPRLRCAGIGRVAAWLVEHIREAYLGGRRAVVGGLAFG